MHTFYMLLIGAHASAIAGYFLDYNLFDVEIDLAKAGYAKAKAAFLFVVSFFAELFGKKTPGQK